MHPLIRIVCFLVFTACLAFGDAWQVLCAFVLLVVGYGLIRVPLDSAARMLGRLRWFFLSLLIVYGWFTPGRALWFEASSGMARFAPTIEGLEAGSERIAALVAIMLSAHLLLRTLSREQLLAAIYGLARPLALFGQVRERMAVRMLLVIELLESTRALVVGRLAANQGGVIAGLRAAGDVTSDLLIAVMQRAEGGAGDIRIIVSERIPLIQWSYPVILWLVFFAAGRLGQILNPAI